MALADSWSAPNPDSAHICLVDEFEILAVNALQIAQVLNLNFGGNFLELTLAATNRIARFDQRPCNTEGAVVPGGRLVLKRPPSPKPLPNPKNHWASPKTPNLEVVVKELNRFIINVLHDDDLLA